MTNLEKFIADPANKNIIKEAVIENAGITDDNKIVLCIDIECSTCKANDHCASYLRGFLDEEADET